LYNLEATPAESTSFRFAKHDTEEFPGILTAAEKDGAPYYTNSSHLPVNYTDDIFDALELEDELQTLYTSGTVFHGFLGERLPDWQSAAILVRKIAKNFRLPYYTLSPTYSVCADHGYIGGEHFNCPKCGKKAEVYSRITGYYRPVRNWNDGKVSEFKSRKTYLTENTAEKEARSTFPSTAERADERIMTEAKSLAAKTTQSRATTANTNEIVSSQGNDNAGKGHRFLLSTHTCSSCAMVRKMLQEAKVDYTPLFAEDPQGAALAEKFNICSVPVLIDGTGERVKLLNNVSEIKGYIEKIQAQ